MPSSMSMFAVLSLTRVLTFSFTSRDALCALKKVHGLAKRSTLAFPVGARQGAPLVVCSLPLTQLRSLGSRGRRCGFNTTHQSTKGALDPTRTRLRLRNSWYACTGTKSRRPLGCCCRRRKSPSRCQGTLQVMRCSFAPRHFWA